LTNEVDVSFSLTISLEDVIGRIIIASDVPLPIQQMANVSNNKTSELISSAHAHTPSCASMTQGLCQLHADFVSWFVEKKKRREGGGR
jgi:hypothetical protein